MKGLLADHASTDASGGRAAAIPVAPAAPPEQRSPDVHRLKDLDRPAMLAAGALAVALLVAPLISLIRYLPDWVPSGDPALMGLRALDVGTSRTPAMGQPSLAHIYVEGHMVRHLGATHFYLLAPFVRLLGAQLGMLTVSVLITGTSLLLAAWAVFRQLGPAAGVLAAVMLGATTFTTGAASLVNPVSSHVVGLPLLCSIVLLWCLVCGDVRLLPLTTVVVSFTAQQHLSVLPVLTIATIVGAVALAVKAARRGWWRGVERKTLALWAGPSAALAGVLWAPVLFQQLFGHTPNLTQLVEFTADDERPTLGFQAGLRQMTHALGLPPMLGRLDLSGRWLNAAVHPLTWLVAGAVVAATTFAGLRWRRRDPRRSWLVVMAAAVALGGLLSGASVPQGIEQFRLVFYHWAFVLVFLVTLVLGLAVGSLVGRPAWLGRPGTRGVLVGTAVLAIALPSLLNPLLERRSSSLQAAYASVDRHIVDELADEVMDHRDEFDGPVVLIARGQAWHRGVHEAMALALTERGLELTHPWYDVGFVADGRLVQRSSVAAGLVLVMDVDAGDPEVGDDVGDPPLDDTIADVPVPDGFDDGGYETPFGSNQPRRLRVLLLDRAEVLDWARPNEIPDD